MGVDVEKRIFRESVHEIEKEFWNGYAKLLKNNLYTFMRKRWNTFINTQRSNVYTQTLVSINLFLPENKSVEPMSLNRDLPGFEPFNYSVYRRSLEILGLNFSALNLLKVIRTLLNSIYIPFCGLLLLFIESIKKRQKLFVCGIAVSYCKNKIAFDCIKISLYGISFANT